MEKGDFMIHNRKNSKVICIYIIVLFFLISCSNIPLIGKKKEDKTEKVPAGKTVTVEGMETIKGVNPPKSETSSKNPSTPKPQTKKETETKVASIPSRPLYSPSIPFFQMGLKKRWPS